jgi:hypothetical protein
MLVAPWKLLNSWALPGAWFPLRNRGEYQLRLALPSVDFSNPALNTNILPYGNGEFKEESQAPRHNLSGIIVALGNEKNAFPLIRLLI